MPEKKWKVVEREVAKALGGQRNPLSGIASGHTAGDVIHPVFYVEVKQRAHFSVLTLMRDTIEKAKKEKKKPVVVLHECRDKSRYYLITEKLFLELLGKHNNGK